MRDAVMKFAEALSEAYGSGALKSVVFHTPKNKSSERLKVKGTPRSISSREVLQFEYFLTEGRVTHENTESDDIVDAVMRLTDEFRRAELITEGGNAALMISKNGEKTSFVSHGSLNTPRANAEQKANDRKKNHLLTGSEAFLEKLGISDANGRVRDKMQPKFRQINRFCEYVVEAVSHLSNKNGTVHIADMCCGKSYLSFAAYHTVTEILERECILCGVDLKRSVIDYCNATARECGFDGMHFVCADISAFVSDARPDIVISLHACDTATDAVLDFAVKNRAEIILATPCCHHELSEKLDCESLAFISDRPLLRQKLCSAATDALRLLRLEAAGYKTDATELIDPEDTPKNLMLRGYRRRSFSCTAREAAAARYNDAYRFLYGCDAPEITENEN